MQDEVDIAIIGAGAAGLGAAMALRKAPVSTLVLEARDRPGGRGWTARIEGLDLDLGCGWLHSANVNPLAALAEPLGFALDKSTPPWSRPPINPVAPAQQAAFGRALDELEARIDAAAARGEDRPVAELMVPGDPLNPRLDAFSSYYNGAEFDRVSTLDFARFEDTGVNWRVRRGYGALIAALGAGAQLRLGAPVTTLDHAGPRLRLETPRGTVTARAAIVTAPSPMIADGRLAFRPDLPAHREAAAALPLGLADKVFLHLDGAEAFEPDTYVRGDPTRVETGSYNVRPLGRPLIEAYLGGRNAKALEAQGPGASAAFAIEELAALLGSDIRARLRPVAATAWGADPWALGSYSYARPGFAGARAAYAEPVENRIFFAGEAASIHAFSTAHGAFATGQTAAAQCLAALGAALPPG
jgi:monoamine oxidase